MVTPGPEPSPNLLTYLLTYLLTHSLTYLVLSRVPTPTQAKESLAQYQDKLSKEGVVQEELRLQVKSLLSQMQELQDQDVQQKAITATASASVSLEERVRVLEARNAQLEEENRILKQRDISAHACMHACTSSSSETSVRMHACMHAYPQAARHQCARSSFSTDSGCTPSPDLHRPPLPLWTPLLHTLTGGPNRRPYNRRP